MTKVEGERWAVFNNMAYHGKHGFLLFSDDNNETAEIYLNALQLRNYSMTDREVTLLGGTNALGIPSNNKILFATGITGQANELVDWGQKVIFVNLSPDIDIEKVPYSLEISYGSQVNIPIKGFFNFSEGTQAFNIIAQDGSSVTWKIELMDN